jgi:hypothetical protein
VAVAEVVEAEVAAPVLVVVAVVVSVSLASPALCRLLPDLGDVIFRHLNLHPAPGQPPFLHEEFHTFDSDEKTHVWVLANAHMAPLFLDAGLPADLWDVHELLLHLPFLFHLLVLDPRPLPAAWWGVHDLGLLVHLHFHFLDARFLHLLHFLHCLCCLLDLCRSSRRRRVCAR